MIRKVIIIVGEPDDENDRYNDKLYLNSYYNYFLSNYGGAYEKDEIFIHEQPTRSEIQQIILKFEAEFAVIVLIGHGATNILNHHVFRISDREIIKTGQLEFNIPKQLIIIESCRNINKKVFTVDITDKVPKFKYGGKYQHPIQRDKAKEMYIHRVRECKKGITICLACSIDETAWNYYFSFSLNQISFDWQNSSQNSNRTIGILSIMNLVKLNVSNVAKQNLNEKQNPTVIGFEDFPFVISKF